MSEQRSAAPEAEQAEASASSSIVATLAQPARSLLNYFGNGTVPSSSASNASSSSAVPRKRRKKVEDDPGQARFFAHGAGEAGGSGWAMGRKVEKEEESKKGGRKAKASGDGETAELKEMNKRTKGGKKPKKGEAAAIVAGEEGNGDRMSSQDAFGIGADLSDAGPSSDRTAVNRPRPSPAKRKRGRPRKTDSSNPHPASRTASQASTVRSQVSPPIINILSSDPPEPAEGEDDERPIITGIKLEKSLCQAQAHPFFSRANSSSSKGASQKDPIDIDDPPGPGPGPGKAGPKKLVFAADQKAAHGFFGKRLVVTEGAEDQPVRQATSVVLDGRGGGEAERVKMAVQVDKEMTKKEGKVNPFFLMSNQVQQPGKLNEGWGGNIRSGEEWLAPLPGRVWPTHVGQSQTLDALSFSSTKRRKVSPSGCGNLESFFCTHAQSEPSASPIPRSSASAISVPTIDHPAIRSIPWRSRKSQRGTWCERYRPQRASHVLGNEVEAAYLRDWLKILSVGQDGAPSAKVARRVPRRKAHLGDGWIVDDIGLFDDELEGEIEEDFEAIEDPGLPFGPRLSAYPPFEQRLANTILITGLHGSGKSAAVYAVAEELGWEVFEVYPGVGRRTGANLLSLVGEVGKNHIVMTGKSPRRPKSKSQARLQSQSPSKPIKPFFGIGKGGTGVNGSAQRNSMAKRKMNKLPVLSSSQGSQGDPIQLDDTGWDGRSGRENGAGAVDGQNDDGDHDNVDDQSDGIVEVLEDSHHGFRQSVILLDEVDLLFEEESTFWPAVIALIAESRRPVILTCNDPQNIPIASLPLQTILRFEPPSTDLAKSYLSSIAKHEQLPQCNIHRLYTSSFTSPPDVLDQPSPLPPNGHEPVPYFDLRRAITQMQLDRKCGAQHQTPVQRLGSENESDCALSDLVAVLNQRSFCDAWVLPRDWARLEASEIDRYEPTSDDLLGVHALLKPAVNSDRPVLATNSREKEIGSYLETLGPGITLPPRGDLSNDQITYIRATLPLLDPIIPIGSNLLPHSSLFTDYVPVLRTIVEADDLLQLAEEEALARGEDRLNRKTGRPVRISSGAGAGFGAGPEYVRYLGVAGKEGEDVVRRYKLPT